MTVANVQKPPINWPTAIFMVAVHMIALLAFLPTNFSWSAIAVALFLHWLTGCLGITLGWHRLVAHRSFSVPKWLEYFFVLCGPLSGLGCTDITMRILINPSTTTALLKDFGGATWDGFFMRCLPMAMCLD